ncbi:MAG: VWA domain-containing protein [Bacteroidales bacterium]|nr:VWA domain-containing protein [Bacteroidales bacterium]
MTYAHPQYLWFLLRLIPLLLWYILKKRKSQASIRFSSTEVFKTYKKPLRQYLRHVLFLIRMIIIVLLIIILARPQTEKTNEKVTEGIDIVIALDISGSMLAQDFKPNRLEASKDIAVEFITKQEFDRIGLVVFSGESFTQCPVTLDHAVLINMFKDIKQGLIEDGTAIGYGLATAVNNLKDSKSKSKIVILLTDGENNAGNIDPMTAADLAAKFGIKVYTVGVGKNGFADMPVQTIFGQQLQQVEVKIDEETLKTISKKTDGRYFRATDNNSLKLIYEEINKLEKDKIKEKLEKYRDEEFMKFLFPALLLLISEMLLRLFVFRNIP